MPVNKDFYMLAGSSGQSTGFEINQSARFNQDDGSYLQDPNSNAGDSRKKFTFSTWFKRGDLGDNIYFYSYRYDDNNLNNLYFDTNDKLNWIDKSGGSTQMNLITNGVFRDPSAWYHVVLQWDTAQDISGDRAKMFINGSRVTDFGTETYPSQNADSGGANRASANMRVAALGSNAGITDFFDGYFAETHYSDNYSYGPEYFGEFDSNSNWIPKQVDISYGAASFYFDYATASNLGTNTKGKGNYSEATDQGAGLADHDQVLDTPTNSFNTMNPLNPLNGGALSNGNLKNILSGDDQFYTTQELNFKSYCEVRIDALSNYGGTLGLGTFGGDDDDNSLVFQTNYSSGYIYLNGGNASANIGGTVSAGNIVMMAYDPTTRKWWVGVNGTWRNSGDPAGGTGQVYQHSTTDFGVGIGAIVWGGWKGSANGLTVTWNFGQEGTFGGQETAGGNSDSNGIGNFKYSVPSGFLANCTKNLFKAGG